MTYDPDGNRLQEAATVPAYTKAPDLSRTVQYQYDGFDELTQEASQATTGTTALNYNYTFAYDLSGNPTTSSRLRGSGFNADNQNTSVMLNSNSAAVSYNGNGDPSMLPYEPFGSSYATGLSAATYDPEDRLTLGDDNDLRETYDGDGLRSWDYTGSAGVPSYHLFDGSTSVVEAASDQDNAELSFSLYGTDGLAGRLTQFDGYIAETYDPQGNALQPVHLYSNGTTMTAQVQTSTFYDAFGQGGLYTAYGGGYTPAVYNPVGFGGQFGYYHEYTGHYLLGHRFYDAGMGRFVTRDPIGYKGGINLYGFAGNNPVNDSDPSGYQTLEDAKDEAKKDSADSDDPETTAERVDRLERRMPDSSKEQRDMELNRRFNERLNGISAKELLQIENKLDEEAANFKKLTGGPSEAFSRKDHYGRTPTRPQKNSVPKGMLFDHDPPLGQHYYEGDGQGDKPGYQMTQAERLNYARRLDVGRPAVPNQRHGQGGTVKAYTERMRKMYGLPPYSKP